MLENFRANGLNSQEIKKTHSNHHVQLYIVSRFYFGYKPPRMQAPASDVSPLGCKPLRL